MTLTDWFNKRKIQQIAARDNDVYIDDSIGKLWTLCYNCGAQLPKKDLEGNLMVCPNCDYHFRIGAKVINIVRGPKVTRYELTLPDGVSVNRVLSIETDIAIAIEAKSKIRIEPHIPGKKAFGIELANDNPSTVGMRELLESPEFTNTSHPLPIAIGKDTITLLGELKEDEIHISEDMGMMPKMDFKQLLENAKNMKLKK